MDIKNGPTICGVQEIHFRYKETNRLKAKGREKIFHANSNQRQ